MGTKGVTDHEAVQDIIKRLRFVVEAGRDVEFVRVKPGELKLLLAALNYEKHRADALALTLTMPAA